MRGRDKRKRDRKSLLSQIKINTQQPSTSTAHFDNQFSNLEHDVDLSDEDSMSMFSGISSISKRSKPNTKKQPKNSLSPAPPPLTIIGQDYSAVTRIIGNVKIFDNDFSIKLSPFGIKVFPATTENFKKLKTHLISTSVKFFTHSLREEQTSKFVLHGLNDMPENDILTLLKEESIEPIKVKKMNILKKKFADHCAYLIYFPKIAKMKISRLREITSLNYIKIRWEFYSNRRKGPIQCSNCLSFGHGGNGCFLPPACIRCSKSHKSHECPHLIDSETLQVRIKIPESALKCVLCGQNHTANYSKCEKRLEYIERQKRYREKIQRKSVGHFQNFQQTPAYNKINYPPLSPHQAMPNSSQTTNDQIRMSDVLQNNSLFTSTELLTIFQEMMTKMQAASTKIQQISVLGEMVIKYCSK